MKTGQTGFSPDMAAKGEMLAHAYSLMGYDAVAVGPHDLLAGLDFLVKSGKMGIPWISANISDTSGALLFEPYREVTVGSLKVALIGLTGSMGSRTDGFLISDDLDLLQPYITALAQNNDILVLLSSMKHEQNVDAARLFPELAIIVGADPKRDAIPAQLHHGTIIVQPGNRGRYLGLLRAAWTGAPWGETPDAERLRLQERMASLTHQLHRLSIQANRDNPKLLEKKQHLEHLREETKTALERVEQTIHGQKETPVPSSYRAAFLPLDQAAPEDPRIREILETTGK